jgi:hypothetical protein
MEESKEQLAVTEGKDWDKWLIDMEASLKLSGYRRYNQYFKSEDFAYWKSFYDDDLNIYQVGVLFYDFRKYIDIDPNANRISIQYECMLICDDRIDLSTSKRIEVFEFEKMAKTFYEAMSKYTTINNQNLNQ